MITTIKLIQHLVPDAEAIIVGEPTNQVEYDNQVQWLDARSQPSWADLEAARPSAETAASNATAKNARAAAYRAEADPLFFGWQRNENTEQEWLDKVAEIRARHPYA